MTLASATRCCIAGAFALLASCRAGIPETALTVENYDRIKTGMAYADVQAILGRPGGCSDTLGVRTCTWGDDERSISINFVADKVLLTSARNIR